MNSIRCLIVDDEPKAREVLDIYIQDYPELNLIAKCKNAIEAINIMANQKIDLLFLDIEMPEISGLVLAKSLNKDTAIIFTTAYRDYAVEGFDLRAIDYLLKPIRPERFKEAIEKYEQIKREKPKATQAIHLFVRSDRKMIKLMLIDILYIESLSDYLKIHTINGIIITRETLKNLTEKLPEDIFIRIHRSFIVNINHIKSFTKEDVHIKDTALSISRSYKDLVHQRLTNQ